MSSSVESSVVAGGTSVGQHTAQGSGFGGTTLLTCCGEGKAGPISTPLALGSGPSPAPHPLQPSRLLLGLPGAEMYHQMYHAVGDAKCIL